MAQVYTDQTKPYGRERYSGPAWMGKDGERAVDLAWEDKAPDVERWATHEAIFPLDRREDAKHVYLSALEVMRAQGGE
jgi:hypothetical protein